MLIDLDPLFNHIVETRDKTKASLEENLNHPTMALDNDSLTEAQTVILLCNRFLGKIATLYPEYSASKFQAVKEKP